MWKGTAVTTWLQQNIPVKIGEAASAVLDIEGDE
jgi:hypothetical protein